jgi:hypothetical protein
MVVAVGAQNGPAEFVIQLVKPLEPPVDVHVVNQKVNHTINADANTNKRQPEPARCVQPDDVRCRTRNGKNEEEQIILLEKTIVVVVWLMVVFVPDPEGTVHEVFMGRPGDEFHGGYGSQCDSGVE